MHKRYIIHKISVANKYWKNTKVNYKVKLNSSKSFNTITVVNGNRLYIHTKQRFVSLGNQIQFVRVSIHGPTRNYIIVMGM